MKRFPVIGPAVDYRDIALSMIRSDGLSGREFRGSLALSTGNKSVFLADSGLSAFYLILTALKADPSRDEVVLPAYTAGSLVVAVRKAGLKPVLCDISLNDFNLDFKLLPGIISEKTLGVVVVHMFGIPAAGMPGFSKSIPPGVFLIEDCCQAQGSMLDGKPVGDLGDAGFFSFNRGKNFCLFGGGCAATNDPELAGRLENNSRALRDPGWARDFFLPFKMWLSLAATRPQVYGLAYPFISFLKETKPPDDFTPGKISGLRSSLGAVLSGKSKEMFGARRKNAEYLLSRLRPVPGLRLPELQATVDPAYNRLPVLFSDTAALEKKVKQLWRAGFETSRMYLAPLHKMFDLGYRPEEFPNAGYFSGHVLTIPVYPGLEQKDMDRIIEVVKR